MPQDADSKVERAATGDAQPRAPETSSELGVSWPGSAQVPHWTDQYFRRTARIVGAFGEVQATYAVFTARGPCTKAIQDTTRYIYSTWLPESGYEHAMTADLEVYDERCSDDDTSEVDIYIPIVKSETA
ncbi:MAG: GyrI-like domain-containing protein [Anaerolineales bacterium]